MAAEFEELSFESQAEWERWLARHHAASRGVWLKFARKGKGPASLTHNEALEEALRYGWIDMRTDGGDATHWRQRFGPRAKRSIWSKVNRAKAEALIATGRMQAAGLAEVQRAKADGRWAAAYDGASTISMPADLAVALEGNPKAKAAFEALDSRNRYAVLHRTQTAKKPETRAKRIAGFVEMLERGDVLHPRKA